jgi:hypothetical protein
MSETELDALISRMTTRYAQLRKGSSQQESFLAHPRSLGDWEREPMDYPDVVGEFPEIVPIAYAVCHPECGTEQLIVDGSTQECQRCGRLMFRTAAKEYVRK